MSKKLQSLEKVVKELTDEHRKAFEEYEKHIHPDEQESLRQEIESVTDYNIKTKEPGAKFKAYELADKYGDKIESEAQANAIAQTYMFEFLKKVKPDITAALEKTKLSDEEKLEYLIQEFDKVSGLHDIKKTSVKAFIKLMVKKGKAKQAISALNEMIKGTTEERGAYHLRINAKVAEEYVPEEKRLIYADFLKERHLKPKGIEEAKEGSLYFVGREELINLHHNLTYGALSKKGLKDLGLKYTEKKKK